MTSNSQSTDRSTKASNPEGYAAAITGFARIQRSLRDMGDSSTRYGIVATAGPIARKGAVSGPLTAEEAERDDDMRAEIARQDANPDAYVIRSTPEQLAEIFNVPVEWCQGLGSEG